jgi:hypothetical protein
MTVKLVYGFHASDLRHSSKYSISLDTITMPKNTPQPSILISENWNDYELLDTGRGQK